MVVRGVCVPRFLEHVPSLKTNLGTVIYIGTDMQDKDNMMIVPIFHIYSNIEI